MDMQQIKDNILLGCMVWLLNKPPQSPGFCWLHKQQMLTCDSDIKGHLVPAQHILHLDDVAASIRLLSLINDQVGIAFISADIKLVAGLQNLSILDPSHFGQRAPHKGHTYTHLLSTVKTEAL